MSLSTLKKELAGCRYCEDAGLIPEARPVFQLSATAHIGIFGQAPGNLVHETGKPFNDPSGVRLRQWMGISDAEFYDPAKIAIAPMAFCFPGYDGKSPTGKGGDLPPPKICAEIWRARIMNHLEKTLKLVLLVGSYSQKWHLGDRMGRTMTETVAAWRERVAEGEGAPGRPVYLPIPHPSWRNTAWLRRNPWFEEEVVPYMQAMIRRELDG